MDSNFALNFFDDEPEDVMDELDPLLPSSTSVSVTPTPQHQPRRAQPRPGGSSGLSRRSANWSEQDSLLIIQAFKYYEEQKKGTNI